MKMEDIVTMRLSRFNGGVYLVLGPILHKSLETGFQFTKNEGVNVGWRFCSRGDHAGLTFHVELFGLLVEFNVTDVRHWNWEKGRFMLASDSPFEGYPHE